MGISIVYKRLTIIAAAVVLTAVSAGCGKTKETLRHQATEVNEGQVEAYNGFALRITEKLLAESRGENVLLSPPSIAFALSLAASGAAGNTGQEILEALGTGGFSLEELNEGSDVLRDLLEHGDPSVQVEIANGIWSGKEIRMLDDYSGRVKRFYGAEMKKLDFEAPDAANAINNWVKKSTHERIDHIVDSSLLSSSKMLLVNAIYFNGAWTNPFEASGTRDAPFHLENGSEVTVPMMRQSETLAYKANERFSAVRLPYGTGKWGMIIVLPGEKTSLTEMGEELLADAAVWREGLTSGRVNIELPRFTFDYGKQLKDVLSALGIHQAFDPAAADFSAMTESGADVYISGVLHKSFIEVNERGTEAAGVTSIGMAGSAETTKPPFEMKVDRPFLFAIEDHTTGAIVFLGAVFNPAG